MIFTPWRSGIRFAWHMFWRRIISLKPSKSQGMSPTIRRLHKDYATALRLLRLILIYSAYLLNSIGS